MRTVKKFPIYRSERQLVRMCGVCSWFSAARNISISYNLQIRRIDQWFSALQVLISNSCAGNFDMPEY